MRCALLNLREKKYASDSYQHAVRLMNHAALQIVRSFHEGEVAAIWG
jgi:hypothetical protein